jgi:hypothetical protein
LLGPFETKRRSVGSFAVKTLFIAINGKGFETAPFQIIFRNAFETVICLAKRKQGLKVPKGHYTFKK